MIINLKFKLCMTILLAMVIGWSHAENVVLPKFNTAETIGGSSVTDFGGFAQTLGDFTLEVEAKKGTMIELLFGQISYTPTKDGIVRFVQQDEKVYVFENGHFVKVLTPVYQYSEEQTNIVRNGSFENTSEEMATGRWKAQDWNAWDGTASTWGGAVPFVNVREDAKYRSDGKKSIILHSNSRWLCQELDPRAIKANAIYKFSCDYWTSAGDKNGNGNYQLQLGSSLASADLLKLDAYKTLNGNYTKQSYTVSFQAPASVPASVFLSLYRAESKVDWLDNVKLIRILPKEAGLKGTSSAVYTIGAYAPAIMALYNKFQDRIDYAGKVLKWWNGDARKASALDALAITVTTAKTQISNYELTEDELNQAIEALNTSVKGADKKIYCSNNACGTDAKLQNSSNQWCYERSMQSKHWILFWEAGYGNSAPSSVESILNTADEIFECYANNLKFLTINQGKSKTDIYKMIIRLRYTDQWEASGSGIDNMIGLLTLSRWAYTSRGGQTVAHEIGHCFQYQTHCDNKDSNGWMYTWANSQYGNVFWEMCAQWQAYKFYPNMQFSNEWLNNTINGFHKNPLAEELRYNNFFIQDFFCHKHGMDAIGNLWNQSKKPEDPFQAYMRLYMDSQKSNAEKQDQFNDEMWEYGARLTTFDMDGIRSQGANTIGKRKQTQLTQEDEGYWCSKAADCIENFGNNAIRLNVPSSTQSKKVYAELIGEAGKDGFVNYKVGSAGWKFGFVALQKDGTRVYGDITTTNYSNPRGLAEFECPANCSYLWLVVSGAPTAYWSRGWNGKTEDDEQWPYKVKFYQTNVYGNVNNDDVPSGIQQNVMQNGVSLGGNNVYSVTGVLVRKGNTSLVGLPAGIYIVKGKKVVVK